jgi:hypothetical protein
MQKERQVLAEKLQEFDHIRQDEDEKLKGFLRNKVKVESQCNDLAEQLKRETEVCSSKTYKLRKKSIL